MSTFQQEWDVETAMKILAHPTVDSQLWAEAVEWLLLYGPPEIKEMLQEASAHATAESFPDLKPLAYDQDGTPYYSVPELADALGLSEEEAQSIIEKKEEKHGVQHIVDGDDNATIQ